MRNDTIVKMDNILSDTCKLTYMYMFMYANCAAVNKTEGCHLIYNKCKVSNSNINNNAIKRCIDKYKIFECDSSTNIHISVYTIILTLIITVKIKHFINITCIIFKIETEQG